MRLYVVNEDSDTNVWCEDVPTDFTDSDVQWNIEQWRDAGDEVARAALAAIPGYWIRMNADRGPNGTRPTSRCYRDG